MENLSFDRWQFERRYPQRVVSAETQISFQDSTFMGVQTHKPSGERKLPTPEWSLNDEKLRQVLVHYMEKRAGIPQGSGALKDRLARACARVIANRARIYPQIEKLSAEYRVTKDAKRRRRLAIEIENLDTSLYVNRNGFADVALRVAYLYFRCKYDSVRVGIETGLKPPHVRHLLHRLDKAWKEIENGKAAHGRGREPKAINLTLLAALWNAGLPAYKIARVLGTNSDRVNRVVRAIGPLFGLATRSQGYRPPRSA